MKRSRIALLAALLGLAVPSFANPESDLAALEKRADALLQQKRPEEAIKVLQEGLRSDPKWRAGLWRVGGLFYEAGRYAIAQQALQKLVEVDPKAGAPWALLGMCEFDLHNYGLAAEHIQRGLSLGIPPELELAGPAYYHAGMALLADGRFDLALTIFKGLGLKNNVPDEAWPLAIGLATLRIPILPETAALALPPERVAILRRLGELQIGVARGDLKDGRKQWQDLVNSSARLPGLHAALGKFLLELADPEAAEIEFRAELKNNPADSIAKLGLAFALMERDQNSEAVRLVEEALQQDPLSANGHHLLGALLVRQGRYEEARVQFEASRELDPYLSRVHYALAQVYLKLGRVEEAARERALHSKLQAAEDEFRKTGKLPAAFFEVGTPR